MRADAEAARRAAGTPRCAPWRTFLRAARSISMCTSRPPDFTPRTRITGDVDVARVGSGSRTRAGNLGTAMRSSSRAACVTRRNVTGYASDRAPPTPAKLPTEQIARRCRESGTTDHHQNGPPVMLACSCDRIAEFASESAFDEHGSARPARAKPIARDRSRRSGASFTRSTRTATPIQADDRRPVGVSIPAGADPGWKRTRVVIRCSCWHVSSNPATHTVQMLYNTPCHGPRNRHRDRAGPTT